ncbi:DNA topology modulation protein [Emticicia sp. BO119]|uniref:DNA topology modulation protein n=1 Tax=Emticicia sp. BO119 TaxID=2757768 RepID=UPI0015F017B8|nr:DNA topology modulation protein [Emticicia sp. BO119]MBA4852857.1 DNA topology modulation protein [Emticicia sp. BO119]
MKRIVIVGCGGAGKSTLARQLSEILHLPVIHLDKEFWQPGWEMRPKEEERKILEEVARQKEWIIDGNYQSTMQRRFEAADTIIFLDFSTLICLRRVIKRYFEYRGTTRPDMTEGCPEKLDWEFLSWIIGFRHSYRSIILKKIAQYGSHSKVLVFQRPQQVGQFLNDLEKNSTI